MTAVWKSLHDAAAMVEDGMTIALGGMTLYRRPVAFVRALLRRERLPRDLTLLCFTAGFESDLMVGAGCVARVRSAYFGLESFGFAPMFTQAAQQGRIEVIEETEASIVMGIRAALAQVAFMPSRAWIGTDLFTLRPDVKQVEDPYTGEVLTAFPAIHCDLAVLHGLAGDLEGNVLLNKNLGIDQELVYLARQVIGTVETRVDRLQSELHGMLIPYPGVDVLVHAPLGASPTSCYPQYPLCGQVLMDYVEACNAGNFSGFLQHFLASAP